MHLKSPSLVRKLHQHHHFRFLIVNKTGFMHFSNAIKKWIFFSCILISRLTENIVFRGILISRFFDRDHETAEFSCKVHYSYRWINSLYLKN